jgi:hypothetical protein
MLERFAQLFATLFLVGALFSGSGCTSFSKSARQQRSYAKYVQRQSFNRHRQQAKFKAVKEPPKLEPSQPKATAGVYNGPQSVSSNEPPPDSEPQN